MTVDFCGALRAKGDVMRRAQVRVHPQLAVDECGDGLDGQMFGRTELARRTDRRVALRCELSGKPGERTAEHMSPVDHHRLLSVSRRFMGTTSNVARYPIRNTNEQRIRRLVS